MSDPIARAPREMSMPDFRPPAGPFSPGGGVPEANQKSGSAASGVEYGNPGSLTQLLSSNVAQTDGESLLKRLLSALSSQLAGQNTPTVQSGYKDIDQSGFNSPKALGKWDALLDGTPPAERDQAARELNRPIAVARMIAEGGPQADKAWAFLEANPDLKTAMDTAQGGKADGKITKKDARTFARNMEKQVERGTDSLNDYRKDNPDAGPQSTELVRSAAMMMAYEPITAASDPSNAQGAQYQKKVNGRTTSVGLQAMSEENPGLSGLARNAATTWAQPGMFEMMDQGNRRGKKLATHAPDGLMVKKDISAWIKNKAPTDDEGFSRVISDAATVGAVAKTDIRSLGKDVFANPQNYSGEQKSAVLVELQQVSEYVVAGRSIRGTEATETALGEKITQLQNDPDVQAFLADNVEKQAQMIVGSDPALASVVNQTATAKSASGATGMSAAFVPGGNNRNTNDKKEDVKLATSGFQEVADIGDKIGVKRAGSQAAVGIGGRVAAAVGGRIVGAIAGQAAGAAAASAIGAAAGPVGWVVSGAIGLGMGISEIVSSIKERKERKAFSRTVNPVLDQFDIPRPK
ncbi:type III effector HrpK domain-containing protein [Pseudomonas viridiflava]|uniref:type III effector HrpK domain-containing protein n=1 Tax=Pseudomonas viridiflava TaxID=33069 RepID=UPI002A6B1191|nr:type III effector HrpK domain-containing protein [Pseudomonas viridiflava]MDY0918979.1 type III effector HrpK domain-containing protein [Pseudomonas viridiflava]